MKISPLCAKPQHFREYLNKKLNMGSSRASLINERALIQKWYKSEHNRKLLLALPENLKRERIIRYLNFQELEVLFRNLGVSVCASFLRFIYGSGLQLQEALDLRRKDLDLENHRVFVASANRRISRESIVAHSLQPELQLLTDISEPNDYLFSVRTNKKSNRKKPLARRTPQALLESVCKRLNLEDISVRTLRDNFAIHLLQVGISEKDVARFMGFRNPQSIQPYQDFVSQAKLDIHSPSNAIQAKNRYWILDNYKNIYDKV